MRVRDLLKQPLQGKRGHLSVRQVQDILGVSTSVLQQWLARDLIPFESVEAGKRTWRRFNIRDLPRLVIIAAIIDQGVPISDAVENVDMILDWKYPAGKVPSAILWFRQINLIIFASVGHSILDEFHKRDCASCLILSVDELQRKTDDAASMVSQNDVTN